ncbi:uncharacterized [Tachysurus ichikawai]
MEKCNNIDNGNKNLSLFHRDQLVVVSVCAAWRGVEVVRRGLSRIMGGLAVGIFSLAVYVFSAGCLALAVSQAEPRDRHFTSEKPQTFRFALDSDAV